MGGGSRDDGERYLLYLLNAIFDTRKSMLNYVSKT